MRISDWSSDVCSSDLFGTAVGYGDGRAAEAPGDRGLHRPPRRPPGAPAGLCEGRGADGRTEGIDRERVLAAGPERAMSDEIGLVRTGTRQIGRANVCTPVTNAHFVCPPLPQTKKQHTVK